VQTALVVLILAAAVLFLASRALHAWQRARAPRDGCGSDCGCSSATPAPPRDWGDLRS
jgi:hypothetical protein